MSLLDEPKNPRPNGWGILIRLIICIGGLGWLFIQTASADTSIGDVVVFGIFVMIYVLVGYHYMPEPDSSNLGWMGGLMDNPLRLSDDINRFLLALKVLLYPGKFIGMTLIDLKKWIKN